MAITIQGIRVKNYSVARELETGLLRVAGNYELVTELGVVMATQEFNGYSGLKVTPSPATSKLLGELTQCLTSEINSLLGLG